MTDFIEMALLKIWHFLSSIGNWH